MTNSLKPLPFHVEDLIVLRTKLHGMIDIFNQCSKDLQSGVEKHKRYPRHPRYRSMGLQLEEMWMGVAKIADALGKEIAVDLSGMYGDDDEWDYRVKQISDDFIEAIGDDDPEGHKSYTPEELQEVMSEWYDNQYTPEDRHTAPDCTMREIQAAILRALEAPEKDSVYYYKEGRICQVDPDLVDRRALGEDI